MKKTFSVFLLLIWMLAGCKAKQDTQVNKELDAGIVYHSDIPPEDCYICGGIIETSKNSKLYWGQNNVALISLNTFEVKPIEINRYDRSDGHLREELSGLLLFECKVCDYGGFSAYLMRNCDRGYATAVLDFGNDERLDIDKVSSYLCENCLNEILPRDIEQCFGVGIINLETKEVYVFQEMLSGFIIGDFYVDCDSLERHDDIVQMDLQIFFCPVRYEKNS